MEGLGPLCIIRQRAQPGIQRLQNSPAHIACAFQLRSQLSMNARTGRALRMMACGKVFMHRWAQKGRTARSMEELQLQHSPTC